MFKTLLNKEKRKTLQEYTEVVFATATIVAFVVGRINKKKEEKVD